MTVCCISSSVFKSPVDGDIGAELRKLEQCVESANRLGTTLIRIFSFWRQPVNEAVEAKVLDSLGKAAEIAVAGGVCLAIENGKRTMHSTGAELGALLRQLDSSVFGAVWDPGNCLFGGTDDAPLINGYPQLKHRVLHVHIKDPVRDKAGKLHYGPFGCGVLGIEEQFKLLRADGYQGYISAETHWRPGKVFLEEELDAPGGNAFSKDGYGATDAALSFLTGTLRELPL
jgi:sugar phosphate isomerase/epimerase